MAYFIRQMSFFSSFLSIIINENFLNERSQHFFVLNLGLIKSHLHYCSPVLGQIFFVNL